MAETQTPPLVLVVEDQPLLRMEAVDLLKDAGFETLEALDADEALAILKERAHEITVLFTDIEMPPGLDGIELARQVHERWPNVLLLVTSGRVEIADADLPDHGKFLAKPYPAPALVAKVNELLRQRSPAK